MRINVKSRYTASAIHFAISCSVFLIFILILLFFWFPEPYFSATGGWQGLKLVTLVDLVLGPLLTLIVYNSEKSWNTLRLDLGSIALLQIMALLWGISNVYQQRPVALAFFENVFFTVPASSLEGQNFNDSDFGEQFPILVYVKPPLSLAGKKEMLKQIKHNIAPIHQVKLYHPLNDFFADIENYRLNISRVKEIDSRLYQRIQDFLDGTAVGIYDANIFVLKAKYHDMALVFKKDFQYLGAIRLN